MILEMSDKLLMARQSKVAVRKRPQAKVEKRMNKSSNNKVDMIAIGASTGGTEAIASILKTLEPPMPPIVIVQHMPPVFTGLYAKRMDDHCQLTVEEAKHHQTLEPNCVYIAPGDKHMVVKKRGASHVIHLLDTEKVSGHKPSVDVLFDSVATLPLKQSVGIILTGMGSDGAKGLLKMRQSHAKTLGQDESSCIVYGMPKVAFELGAVVEQLGLEELPDKLKSYL
jgi:two-component system chemotaxis response regulator CheB